MISFIMPAKNASLYINDAITPFLKADYKDWELIVVEDHSADNTLTILKEIEKKDSRIKVCENKDIGKIAGLNYGYTLTNGKIVKCIDADDMLDLKFFDYLNIMADYDALCHDSYVVTSGLRLIGSYWIDRSIIHKDFTYCLKYLKSIPRCAWSFPRHIGDIIFPMPQDLPFEDVWFSLIIKKYARRIFHANERLYCYRQHNNQTYGGLLNFNKEIITFRAKRMLKFIDVIKQEQTKRLISEIEDEDFFEEIESFYKLLAEKNPQLWTIITSDMPMEFKLKLLLYRKLNFFAPSSTRLKWLINKMC